MRTVTVTEMNTLEDIQVTAHSKEPMPKSNYAAELERECSVIEPEAEWHASELLEHWRYRELLYFLVWRDIAVRYKQSLLGAAWAVLQPLAMMCVFSLFFIGVAEMPAGGLPYPLFVLAGILPWFFFANGLTSASQSVVGNQNLVTKIYFPRLLIPMGAVLAGFVDLVISMVLLVLAMVIYRVHPGWNAMLVPLMLIGLATMTMGAGFLLSALTVQYRDFRHVVPFMLQLCMFATPSIYMAGTGSLAPQLQALLPFNPMYGLILNFRVAIVGGEFDVYSLSISMLMSLLLLVMGYWYFRRVERSFADII